MDNMQIASINYLNILENRLGIQWNNDVPIFIPDYKKINSFTIQRVVNEINDIYLGSNFDKCINDINSYSKMNMLSVGFGYVNDLYDMVKLGLVLGDRLVLWDFLWSRVIRSNKCELEEIGLLANELLILKDMVIDGRIVILPPPYIWSDRVKYNLNSIPKEYLDSNTLGLVGVLSLIQDGVGIFPFTITEKYLNNDTLIDFNNYYSKEKQDYHIHLNKFITNNELYLPGNEIKDFYNIIKHNPSLYTSLKQYFDQPCSVQTEVEKEKWLNDKLGNIKCGIEKYMKESKNFNIGMGASVGSVFGIISGIIEASMGASNIIPIITSLGLTLIPEIVNLIINFNKRPEKDTIINVCIEAKKNYKISTD